MTHAPVLSVVDYAAWEKGYMPPSEHVLIDRLSYRGAKVIMSFSVGAKGEQVWLVLEGGPLNRAKRKLMLKIMEQWFEADAEEDDEIARATSAAQRFEILEDGPGRFVLIDHESTERDAPVFETRAEAEAAILLAA